MANGFGGLAGRTTVQPGMPQQLPSTGGQFGPVVPPVAPDPIDSEIDRVLDQLNQEVDEDLVKRQVGPPTAPWYKTAGGLAKTAGRFGLELGGQLLATRLPVGGALVKAALGGLGVAGGSLAAETLDPTKAPLTTALKAGAFGAGGELVGRGLGGVAGRLGAGARRALPEAQEAIDVLSKYGATPTAGQVTRNRAIDVLETIAESSHFGGPRIAATKEKAIGVADELLDNYVKTFQTTGLTREEVGQSIRSAIGKEKSIFKAAERGLYKYVDDLTEGAQVNFTDTKSAASDVLNRMEVTGHSSPVKSVLNAIISQGDVVPFALAKDFRSDLLAISRTTTDILPGRTTGAAKHISGEIDSAMEAAAKKLKGPALEAWRKANAFTAEGKEKFNDAFIKKMVKSKPDAVLDAALQPRRVGQIRQIKEMVNNPEDWKNVQGEFLRQVMGKASPELGEVQGSKFIKELGKYGPATLKEMFEPGQLSELQKFGRVLSTVQGKTHPKGQLAAFRFAQGGAALTLFTAPFRGAGLLDAAAAPILIGPVVLARMMTNPAFVKLVAKGMTLPPGTPEAVKITAQIMALLPAQGVGEREDIEAQRAEGVRLKALAKKQREFADKSIDEAMEAIRIFGRIPQ